MFDGNRRSARGVAGACIALLFGAAVALSSCASFPLGGAGGPRESAASGGAQREERLKIVEHARALLGRTDIAEEGPNFRNDCSGLVLGVYRSLGYDVSIVQGARGRFLSDAIYRRLNERGYTYVSFSPRPADLVFFKGTVDGGGDRVTHVGLVDTVLPDDTVLILNYTSSGVTELRMNLVAPRVHRDGEGTVKNDFLKRKVAGRESEKLLSGELFYSFGDFLGYTLGSPPPTRRNVFE